MAEIRDSKPIIPKKEPDLSYKVQEMAEEYSQETIVKKEPGTAMPIIPKGGTTMPIIPKKEPMMPIIPKGLKMPESYIKQEGMSQASQQVSMPQSQ